jgi:thiol:disulfide interchange protein
MTAAIAAAALTAGCAASSTTAQAPVSPTAAPATTAATPSPTSSARGGATPVATTPAAGQGIPDGYDSTRDANADVRAALAEAAKDHREVLVDFGANWCPDCRALDVMFRSARVEPLLRKDYVVVAVDVGQFNHNLDLAARYVNLQTSGIPALVVLKSNGVRRTATNDGSFSNARSMDPNQVSAFLTRWAPTGDR